MRRLSYPLYLLERAPPGRLAEVALRRLARRLLASRPAAPPTSERAILAGLGAARLDDLPRAFAEAIPGDWPFASPERLRRAARAAASRLPEDTARSLREAERLWEGRVTIYGVERRPARTRRQVEEASASWQAVDWERCPRTERRARRGEAPAGVDPKDAWALGRLDHVVRLALAGLLAEGEARAARWADAALDWCLDFCQAPKGIQWASPMEVALRAANIAFALRALAATSAPRRRPRALLLVLRSLDEHTASVLSRLENTLVVPNNHLLSNVVGTMAVGALLPGLAASRSRAELLAPRFGELLMEQTLEDGFCFEASTGYHRLAAELIALGVLASRALGVELDAPVEARARAVFRVSERLRDGRGLAPQIGDEDSGQALPFRLRRAGDQRHLGGIGRLLFSGQPSAPSWESLWLFGAHASGAPQAEPRGDLALPAAGLFLQRGRRMSAAIACGPNGTGGTGSHGHNDKLSVEVCLDGRRLIVDPGSGRYTSDPALRDRLRGTAHHSTARVDGEEQQELPPGRLFALPEQAAARCLLWQPTSARARFVGEHRGYHRLSAPVTHRREVRLHRGEDRLLVTDTFLGPGEHTVEVRYHLAVPLGSVHVRSSTAHEENVLGRSMRWITELLHGPRPVAILASALPPSLEEGSYAEGYGQLVPSAIVSFGARGKTPMTIATVVSAVIEPKGECDAT